MRKETGLPIGILQPADVRPLRQGRDRIESKQQPVADENPAERDHLPAEARPREKHQRKIPQANLGEDVRKKPVCLLVRRGVGGEQHAEQHQGNGPHGCMTQDLRERISFLQALRRRIGSRHADHEHERRLDQIPQAAAGPTDVVDVRGERGPEAIRQFLGDAANSEAGTGHQEHDEAAVRVERRQTGRFSK